MPTGAEAKLDYQAPELGPAERARAEVRRLTTRRAELPDLMRDAASRGAFQLVAELRLEYDQLPARIWAARYTEVQSELAAWDVRTQGRRDRHGLLEQATRLAQELAQ